MKTFIAILLLLPAFNLQAQNNTAWRYEIANTRLYFKCTGSIQREDKINQVSILGDTAFEFYLLKKALEVQEKDCEIFKRFWLIIDSSGFVLTDVVKPVYNAAVSQYSKWNSSHSLYAISGNVTDQIIATYKNYWIKSTEADNLRSILNALNVNGFQLKPQYYAAFDAVWKDYNEYHAGLTY